MKKQIFILLCFFNLYTIHSQQVLWIREFNDLDQIITDFHFDSTSSTILSNNSLSSNLTRTNSFIEIENQTNYSRVYSNFIKSENTTFTSFLDNNFSGIEKIDSNGNIETSVLLSTMISSNPKIFNWIENKILLVDNLIYSSSEIFPRITVLNQNLSIDTSFFLPQNIGLFEYSSAVVSSQNDLFITGTKEITNKQSLDQMLVRIDSTLHIESSRSFGDNNDNWINLTHQSITDFPGGAIISGQSINGLDTNVTLAVVSKDNISFSHTLLSFSEPILCTQNSLAYLENQSILLLVNTKSSSYLLVFELTGELSKSYAFPDDIKINKLVLSNDLIYALGDQTITCINPNETNSTSQCQLTELNDFNTSSLISTWPPSPFLLDAVGFSDPTGSVTTKASNNDNIPSFALNCPSLFLSGSIMGCKTDTLCISVSGDQSYIWFENKNPEDTLSTNDEFCFSPRNDITYTIKGEVGTTISFSPIVDSSASCIPDTIPIIYDYVSPNGDDENDNFHIKNLEFIRPVSVQVINAQNKVLYESNDYDNTWSPIDLLDGTYFYIVKSENLNQQGNLIIRR